MKQDRTEIVFIIDRSGSMSGLEADTVGGINSVIRKQKELEGEAVVSLVLFNDKMEVVHDRKDLAEIGELAKEQYFASGCTALLDAVGKMISRITDRHNAMPEEERPAKTIFVITTDGMENSSTLYTYGDVKKLIEARQEGGWEFMFLGANIDVAAEAGRLGIREDHAAEFECDEEGLEDVYMCIDDFICRSRASRRTD